MEKDRFIDSVHIYYAVRSIKRIKLVFLSQILTERISHRSLLCFDLGSRGKRENGQNFTANQASSIADPIVLTFKEKGKKKN